MALITYSKADQAQRPKFAPEGGWLDMAEAFYSAHSIDIQCPNCTGRSTLYNTAFNRDQGGKPAAGYQTRRRWVCRYSGLAMNRGGAQCKKMSSKQFVEVAQKCLPLEKYEGTWMETLQTLSLEFRRQLEGATATPSTEQCSTQQATAEPDVAAGKRKASMSPVSSLEAKRVQFRPAPPLTPLVVELAAGLVAEPEKEQLRDEDEKGAVAAWVAKFQRAGKKEKKVMRTQIRRQGLARNVFPSLRKKARAENKM